MRPSTQLILLLSSALATLATISTVYLYLYPLFHNCAFPLPPAHIAPLAPLRLLALGDPQLEGDTSLPDPSAPLLPCAAESWRRWRDGDVHSLSAEIRNATRSVLAKDLPGLLNAQRKRLDLWGNDYYLAHVYRTVRWWTAPSHVAVLGDLLGSQWIDDGEFHRRADRYYARVFAGASMVPAREEGADLEGEVDWERSLINIAGNHDIGYAGDFDTHRAVRFEERFAPLNWELRFQLDGEHASRLTSAYQDVPEGERAPPRLHLVMLNSMNLDSPAYNETLQQDSRGFLDWCSEDARSSRPEDAVVLLTHIPLYKKEGICVDGPFFSYFPEDQSGGISEQNHLTEETSRLILDGLFMNSRDDAEQGARAGVIINGHDHEGCHVRHSLSRPDVGNVTGQNSSMIGDWTTTLHTSELTGESTHVVSEVTLRSMMGSYGGNAGLVSGWFDPDAQRWRFEYHSCMFWSAAYLVGGAHLGYASRMRGGSCPDRLATAGARPPR